ncbi:MAG: immunoglobulin domain-containing protein, partial [Verrucomicrobiota bacterium]
MDRFRLPSLWIRAWVTCFVCLLFASASTASAQYEWSTALGASGQAGATDGSAATARFFGAQGVVMDSSGNTYVADTGNHTIRKISSLGVVSVFAGSAGFSGSADGTGSSARFCNPTALAIDGSGNVVVADTGNCTIRKVNAGGVVTLAGSAQQGGSADGTGSNARFVGPSALAVDASGNVYVADTLNNTIRKINSLGVVTTIAGSSSEWGPIDGVGTAARFYRPAGLALYGGTLYVADSTNQTIRKVVLSTGQVTTIAGGSGQAGVVDGTAGAARFFFPTSLAVDTSGNLFVSEAGSGAVRKVVLSTTAVSTVYQRVYAGPLTGIALDTSNNIYAADPQNSVILKGTFAVSIAPSITSSPVSLTVNSGSLSSFSVTASGTAPLSYQWRKDGTNLSSGTSSTYVIASAQTTDSGNYSVVVSNSAGSVTSASASLTVNKATPTIYVWPSASSISSGQTLASSVLSGGSASVLGAFAFSSSSTAPSVGTGTQAVTFTPTDSTRYNTASGTVSVTVNTPSNDVGLVVDVILGEPKVVPVGTNQVPLPQFFPDGHLPAVQNGNGFLYFSAGRPSCRLEVDASGSIISSKPVLDSGSAGAFDNGGAWLYSVIRYPFSSPTSLVGFYHAEYHWLPDDFIAWKSIALATSTDNGNTWVKGGEIIRSPESRPATKKWGGDGDHCVVWDSNKSRWMCFFTNSTDGCIKMAATRDADYSPGKWFKYYNGGFTEPGLDGKEDSILGLKAVPGGNPSVHFNTQLNRWIMLYHSWDEGVPNGQTNAKSGIWISWSWDLEHWEAPSHLLAPTKDPYSDGLTYAKIWNPTVVGVSDLLAGKTAKLFYSGFQLTTDGVDASGQSFPSDSARYGERYYRVLVQRDITFNGMKEVPPTLNSELLILNGTMGASFATQLNASTNATSIVCTSLPPGLVCSTSGTISGSPTRGGVIVGSAVARNGAGSSPESRLVFLVDAVATASVSGSINVTFDLPDASAIGVKSIKAVPASGSLFSVGTTPVNVAVDTGDGISNVTFKVVVKPFVPPVTTGTVNWTDLVGTYEGLLEQNPDSPTDDMAVYRGAFSLTLSRTGTVSGRVFYNEATALDGSQNRVYVPVIRTFVGMLTATSANSLIYQKVIRLGTGTSLGRQELTLDVSFAETPPRLNVTVKDTAS